MTVPAVGAVVLAGGRGSRMGGVAKPALVVGGVRLIDRVLAAVTPIARVVVVGPPDLALPAGVVRTRENPPGGGPVAALAAGMAAFGGTPPDVVLLLGGDLPFLTADAIRRLIARLDEDHDGVAFADPTGRPQWMCSAWRYEPLLTQLRHLLDADRPPGSAPTPNAAAPDVADEPRPIPEFAVPPAPSTVAAPDAADIPRPVAAPGLARRGASVRALVDGLRVRLIDTAPDGDQPPTWFDCDTEEDLRWAEERWTR